MSARRGVLARARPAAIACLAIALAGCAVYRESPLQADDVERVLLPPDRAALERAARLVRHPRLAPVELDFRKPLTPEEIGIVAVLASPDLQALRQQEHVADAQVFASGLVPDPQFSIGRDRVLSPTDAGLTSAWAASLSLDVLAALAARPVQRQAAAAVLESTRLDIAWQEWATAGQARLLARRLGSQRQAAMLARSAAEIAERALSRALVASGRHDLRADEIETRRIAAADASARAVGAERDADATRLELNRLLGLTPGEQLDIATEAPLPAWAPHDPETLFTAARVARLDLAALAAAYRSQEATLHREILAQYPRLGLTLNRARDTSAVHTVGAAVSLDLPLWNHNRGGVRVALADRQRLRTEYAARLHQTRADIAALTAAIDRDEATRMMLTAAAPKLEDIARAYEDAAERGDATRPVAEAARAAATDRALALLAVEQACAEERLALALAVGQPLTGSDIAP